MEVPSDLKYTKEHEWVRLSGGVATVGITEFAQSELGEIVYVELPEEGASIGKGDSFCTVESTKAASDVYAPIGGTVKAVNASLSDAPDAVNTSPFADGWLVTLDNVNESELGELMNAEQYAAHVAQSS